MSFYQAFVADDKLNLVLQPYEQDFPWEKFKQALQKAAQERGVALGKIYVTDKGYRTSLFREQMTHGRSIQTIKLPTVIKAAPHDYVNKIYEM